MLSKRLAEIIADGIADHDELFRYIQILIQKFRVSLKIALTPLIEDEKVRTGIVAVVRNNKVRRLTAADRIQQAVLHIVKMRTRFPSAKAFVIAASAGADLNIRERINIGIRKFILNKFRYITTITRFSGTK